MSTSICVVPGVYRTSGFTLEPVATSKRITEGLSVTTSSPRTSIGWGGAGRVGFTIFGCGVRGALAEEESGAPAPSGWTF